MASFLPIRAISRSQQVRIGDQKITRDKTFYVDIDNGQVRRDLERHAAFGAFIIVGPLTTSNADITVETGVNTDEGAANNDLVVRTYAGELRNRATGAYVSVAQTDTTMSAADATNPRIDIIQVHNTTGVVTKKNGTAAASPVAPSPDASNTVIARVTIPANDTAITTNQITDVRPRS